jgi:hypothetical protein
MFLFDASAEAHAGMELFDSRDPAQPAGLVANAAPRPSGGVSVLAEVKLAAADAAADGSATLRLGSSDGPELTLRELPYAVPREAIEVP